MSPFDADRRSARRRPILATFAVFVVIPKKGLHRLEVRDMSENGIGFDVDIEGESVTDFPIKIGDSIDFRFYLNHSLFIPMKIKIRRIEDHPMGRRAGAEFLEKRSPSHKAFLGFLNLLDHMVDVVQIDAEQG